MSNKKTLIALSAALALGIIGASAAQASDHEDTGGFRIGPLGQVMGGTSGWGTRSATRGANAYGFFSPSPRHEPARAKSKYHD